MELTHHGNNAAIQVTVLSDERMRELGFTDYAKSRWYFCKRLLDTVSFNLTIEKDGSDWVIDVLDEDFLQPYDYQQIISKRNDCQFAFDVRERVEDTMDKFIECGIVSGHSRYDYI